MPFCKDPSPFSVNLGAAVAAPEPALVLDIDPTGLIDRIRLPLAPAYEIERLLAVGGMALVYVARDTKHDRTVALKVLLPELAVSVGSERFVREIRFAARLTHPNILPVLDSGEVAGLPFYAMPLVQGESLRGRLDREGRLGLEEAVAIATTVADALHYAHAAGIVHRDIKPENILLLGGAAIVTDFGIARAISSATDTGNVTSAGITVGTPAYMSPEQAAGEDQIDGRSDIYSLATVLFEMLTGHVPFTGKTTLATIARRFVEQAPRVSSVVDVPAHIDDSVAAGLELDPEHRPESAASFRRGIKGTEPVIAPAPRSSTATTSTLTPTRSRTISLDEGLPAIAVLPFTNLTSDPENDFFCDGITEEIIGALTRLRTLRVTPRTSSFAFKGRAMDVRAIAEQLGVGSVLEGSVRRAGAQVRVSAQLINAASGYTTWSEQMNRQMDDVFAMQDEIAGAIATALKATLVVGVAGARAGVDGAVYEAYLRGRYALNKRTEAQLQVAVAAFSEATEGDGEFALAFAGLADALLVLGVYGAEAPIQVMPRARAAAERALAIDPALAEAHTTLAVVRALYDWDWPGAADAFRRAITLGPRYPTAHQWHGMNYLLPQRRFAEARAAVDRARTLDPLSPVLHASAAVVRHLSGDASGAAQELGRAVERDPGFPILHYFLGNAARDAGDVDAARKAFERAIELSGGGTPEMLAGLAQTMARQGETDAAREIAGRLDTLGAQRYVSPALRAQVHAALGDQDEALTLLEKALSEHDTELVFIGVRPSYDALRANARFASICAKVGLG